MFWVSHNYCMCLSIWFRGQEARRFIDGHVIYMSFHRAKQVVFKVRYAYPLVSPDVIYHAHMGMGISMHTGHS